MRKITPPISNEAKAYNVVACLRKRQRWHHVASRSLQVLFDQIQGAAELCEPGGFEYLRVRRRIGPMSPPSADILTWSHGISMSKGCAHKSWVARRISHPLIHHPGRIVCRICRLCPSFPAGMVPVDQG